MKYRRISYFCKKRAVKKILVIRFSSIGDIVLTTPVIRCLKEQLPGVEIHYLTKKQFVPILASNPHIDHLHYITGKISEVIPELRKQKFDHIVDLHRNFRSVGVRLKLLRPSSSFPKLNLRKWVLVKFKINLMPDIHIVDRYFKAVSPLGVKNDSRGLEYFIPDEDQIDLASLPVTHRDSYIAFAIGGKHTTKCLPAEKIAEICIKSGQPIILLGGSEDFSIGEKVREEAGNMVLNACGAYSLNQSADLVRKARLVITHDTGLMHIAAAFGKKIISVWGNTVPSFGMYPYMPGREELSTIVEVKGLSCRPCSKLGYDKCPKGHFDCMNKIDIQTIIKNLD